MSSFAGACLKGAQAADIRDNEAIWALGCTGKQTLCASHCMTTCNKDMHSFLMQLLRN